MASTPRPSTTTAARAAIEADPAALADAFFAEAADNDDVTSIKAALDYLEGRLSFFDDLVSAGARAAVDARFRERIAAWEA